MNLKNSPLPTWKGGMHLIGIRSTKLRSGCESGDASVRPDGRAVKSLDAAGQLRCAGFLREDLDGIDLHIMAHVCLKDQAGTIR